jgi:hypothetical protein
MGEQLNCEDKNKLRLSNFQNGSQILIKRFVFPLFCPVGSIHFFPASSEIAFGSWKIIVTKVILKEEPRAFRSGRWIFTPRGSSVADRTGPAVGGS